RRRDAWTPGTLWHFLLCRLRSKPGGGRADRRTADDLMLKRHDLLALLCVLAIPVVILAGGESHRLIEPEMARGSDDYVRGYQLLTWVRVGALTAAAGLALLLWIACCYLVLRSRGRSLWWLALAAAGPFGLIAISMLGDRSPAPGDRYQRLM